jgi:hypothetical protein
MGMTQFLEEFQVLHTRARQGKLAESEQEPYQRAREQFERALLAAQGLMLERDARRNFRIAQALPVELRMHYGDLRIKTLDLSVGGFSVMLPCPMSEEERPGYTLELPGGQVLAGRARLASQRQVGEKHRVSFAFIDPTEQEMEHLEMLLIDLALERVGVVAT